MSSFTCFEGFQQLMEDTTKSQKYFFDTCLHVTNPKTVYDPGQPHGHW